MTYSLTYGTCITRDADGASIPSDIANRDYGNYLAWVAAGNTPTPYVPPAPPVPTTIAPYALLARLTTAEQMALSAAALANPPVLLLLIKLASASLVDVTDPVVSGGLTYCESLSPAPLASGRAAIVLDLGASSP